MKTCARSPNRFGQVRQAKHSSQLLAWPVDAIHVGGFRDKENHVVPVRCHVCQHRNVQHVAYSALLKLPASGVCRAVGIAIVTGLMEMFQLEESMASIYARTLSRASESTQDQQGNFPLFVGQSNQEKPPLSSVCNARRTCLDRLTKLIPNIPGRHSFGVY